MEQALQCTKPENQKYFAVLCARLVPLNRVDVTKLSQAYFVNIHGSVVLQTMLSFQRPKQIIDSLLAMSSKELMTLFFDAKGCHIADSYCGGKFVGVKSKELLVKKLKVMTNIICAYIIYLYDINLKICDLFCRVLFKILPLQNMAHVL